VAWPDGSTREWRCEIDWRSGRFQAQANAPGSRRKLLVAASPELELIENDPADIPRPELASAVRDLATSLEAQGWTPVAPGGRWYSRRFVWTHDGSPPGMEGAG
jgi:hypothetical protein